MERWSIGRWWRAHVSPRADAHHAPTAACVRCGSITRDCTVAKRTAKMRKPKQGIRRFPRCLRPFSYPSYPSYPSCQSLLLFLSVPSVPLYVCVTYVLLLADSQVPPTEHQPHESGSALEMVCRACAFSRACRLKKAPLCPAFFVCCPPMSRISRMLSLAWHRPHILHYLRARMLACMHACVSWALR